MLLMAFTATHTQASAAPMTPNAVQMPTTPPLSRARRNAVARRANDRFTALDESKREREEPQLPRGIERATMVALFEGRAARRRFAPTRPRLSARVARRDDLSMRRITIWPFDLNFGLARVTSDRGGRARPTAAPDASLRQDLRRFSYNITKSMSSVFC